MLGVTPANPTPAVPTTPALATVTYTASVAAAISVTTPALPNAAPTSASDTGFVICKSPNGYESYSFNLVAKQQIGNTFDIKTNAECLFQVEHVEAETGMVFETPLVALSSFTNPSIAFGPIARQMAKRGYRSFKKGQRGEVQVVQSKGDDADAEIRITPDDLPEKVNSYAAKVEEVITPEFVSYKSLAGSMELAKLLGEAFNVTIETPEGGEIHKLNNPVDVDLGIKLQKAGILPGDIERIVSVRKEDSKTNFEEISSDDAETRTENTANGKTFNVTIKTDELTTFALVLPFKQKQDIKTLVPSLPVQAVTVSASQTFQSAVVQWQPLANAAGVNIYVSDKPGQLGRLTQSIASVAQAATRPAGSARVGGLAQVAQTASIPVEPGKNVYVTMRPVSREGVELPVAPDQQNQKTLTAAEKPATGFCFHRTLRLKSRDTQTNKDVSALQEVIGLKPSGFFGPATRQALVRFQQEQNLEPAGAVYLGTRQFLNKQFCKQ